MRIAVKRIAQVEVDPSSSNQHEFNAGQLRQHLGFGDTKVEGTIAFLFFVADNRPPVISTESFTLYDSRENKPHRPPEWRLYYTSGAIAENAQVGDLMVVFRQSLSASDLVAVVLRDGTQLHAQILRDLLPGGDDTGQLRFVESPSIPRDTIAALLAPLQTSEAEAPPKYPYTDHPLYDLALKTGRIPPAATMAAAAHGILAEVFPTGLDPDQFIEEALDAESELFFSIENTLGNKELQALAREGRLDFRSVMTVVTSYAQSRRSRRGESLQNHFARLLTDRGIRFTPQCETEQGETPDFIIPGKEEYHDTSYPSDRLRMVGCKTKVRERYRQWLREAARVRMKYGLCVDGGLSDEVILKYHKELRFFVPHRVKQRFYEGRRVANLVGTVGDLINDLERVTG